MIKEIDITNSKFAEEVLKVQILSYKVEAEIIGFYEIPPLHDTVVTLKQCGETFFGYYSSEKLYGAISIKVEKNVMGINRLIVHPQYFRKGIAKMLLNFVESNLVDIKTIIVSTGSKNIPAVNFYKKNGFLKIGEERINERLSLTSFKKTI